VRRDHSAPGVSGLLPNPPVFHNEQTVCKAFCLIIVMSGYYDNGFIPRLKRYKGVVDMEKGWPRPKRPEMVSGRGAGSAMPFLFPTQSKWT